MRLFSPERQLFQTLKVIPKLALENFHKAIKIQEEIGDSTGLSYSYNNLGISYFYMFRYEEAIRYYRQSAEIDSIQNDYAGWAGTMINIAVIESNGS